LNDFDPYGPECIRARFIIQDVIYRLARAVDRRDTAAIKEAYHPDAIDSHGIFVGGPEEYARFSESRNGTIPFSQHQITNMLIEFASPDLALVETYLLSMQRYSAESGASLAQFAGPEAAAAAARKGIDSIGCHRYVDRFEQRGGQWRIARRTVVFEWRSLLQIPDVEPRFDPAWTIGRRDANDWLFQERAALGLSRR